MVETKIVSFDVLTEKLAEVRKENKRIVLCNGMFHSLHVGHMRYLRRARDHGDIVVVSITGDKWIEENSHTGFEEGLRAEAVASLDMIDFVVINPFKEVVELIERIKPTVFMRGFESAENGIDKERATEQEKMILEKIGVELVVGEEYDFTSTVQINRYLSSLPEDIQNYLRIFKQRYSIDELLRTVSSMKDLKVMVIGDTILDEYRYCTAIGKSSKDPTLVLKYESSDVFAGGVLAVANHVANFVGRVDLVTVLGQVEGREGFIRAHLKENIRPQFVLRPNAPTLTKQRFLDGYSMNKLLEVYIMDDSSLDEQREKEFFDLVKAKTLEYDLIIAADFGHGAISSNLRNLLSESARFLAVNAQSNAGNRGYNNITKYRKADYVSIAEHEIRLELRDLTGKLWPMVNLLAERMGCRKFAVTRGQKGCLVHDRQEGGFIQVPSFAQRVIDRVGAGDAFFAITSLAAVLDAPAEVTGFFGNVAGSLAVEIMGNQKSVGYQKIIDYLHRLLS